MRVQTHREPRPDVGRRALALWAVVLWVLGFEIGPDLHIGLHGQLGAHAHGDAHVDDDTHDDAHAHAHAHPHAHDAHAQDRTAEHDRDPRHSAIERLDPQHGRHDLAHRGIAVLVPDVATPRVADADFAALPHLEAQQHVVFDRTPLHDRARGPPEAPSRLLVNRPA